MKVKLLAEPGSLRLIGAQMVGGEGIKERADFLAMAVRTGITLHDLADDGERLLARRSARSTSRSSVAAQNGARRGCGRG